MSIKNILLAYNGSEASDAALRMATLMHQVDNAHVTGLLAHGQSRVEEHLRPWMSAGVHDSLLAVEDKLYHEINDHFHELTTSIDSNYCHWIDGRGDADTTVAEYARMYDITLVGRYDALLGAENLVLHPKTIIKRSGRPVLLVPKAWDEDTLGEHAIFIWDGQLASAKTLAAALPLLQTKKTVTVLTIEDGDQGTPLPGINVQTVLQRHGLTVKDETIKASKRKIGMAIVDFCNASDADLLVLGLLERSVWHDALFGDVNQLLIRQTHLPMLMSA